MRDEFYDFRDNVDSLLDDIEDNLEYQAKLINKVLDADEFDLKILKIVIKLI